MNQEHTFLKPAIARSVLRIIVGFTFSLHGAQKLLGAFGGLPGGMKPSLFSIIGIAGVLELLGGILMMLGLFTRYVAFILCGEMAFAYFRMHAPRGFWPIVNGGELAVLYCFIFLYLFASGPGVWSLDSLLRRRTIANPAEHSSTA